MYITLDKIDQRLYLDKIEKRHNRHIYHYKLFESFCKCAKCESSSMAFNGYRTIALKDLPNQGLPVIASLSMPRYECTKCGRVTQIRPVNVYIKGHRSTLRLRELSMTIDYKQSSDIGIDASTMYKWRKS